MMSRKYTLILVAVLTAVLLAGCSGAATEPATNGSGETPAAESPAPETPATTEVSADEELVQTKCSMCHDLSRVDGVTYDRDQWEETMTRMQQNGLVVTDDERDRIIEYLTERDAAK